MVRSLRTDGRPAPFAFLLDWRCHHGFPAHKTWVLSIQFRFVGNGTSFSTYYGRANQIQLVPRSRQPVGIRVTERAVFDSRHSAFAKSATFPSSPTSFPKRSCSSHVAGRFVLSVDLPYDRESQKSGFGYPFLSRWEMLLEKSTGRVQLCFGLRVRGGVRLLSFWRLPAGFGLNPCMSGRLLRGASLQISIIRLAPLSRFSMILGMVPEILIRARRSTVRLCRSCIASI